MHDRHPKGHACFEKLYLLISSNCHSTVCHWLGKSSQIYRLQKHCTKKNENTEGGRDWNEARMHLVNFLNVMKKHLFDCGRAIGEKSLNDPSFFTITLLSPKKSDPPVLSMFLLFYTMSTAVSKAQEAWQGNQKGIPRMKLDTLKDDLRTPSQEKRYKRFTANCFQKVELKMGWGKGIFMDSTNSESPDSFTGVYFKKKSHILILLKVTSASLLCEKPTQTGKGNNSTRCQSELKITTANKPAVSSLAITTERLWVAVFRL